MGHPLACFLAGPLRDKQQWTEPNFFFASHLPPVNAGIDLLIV